MDQKKAQNKICTYTDCLLLATWKPVVVIRTPENDNSFELEFQYFMCDKHKNELKLNDIIGDKNIDQIKLMFKEKFIYPPKKENMVLKWNHMIPVYNSKGLPIGFAPMIR